MFIKIHTDGNLMSALLYTHANSYMKIIPEFYIQLGMVGELGICLGVPPTSRSGIGKLLPRGQTLSITCFYKVLLKHRYA